MVGVRRKGAALMKKDAWGTSLSVDEAAQEIIRLYAETPIRIGELLCGVKSKLYRGNLSSWITTRMPFSPNQATQYVKLFKQHLAMNKLKESGQAGLVSHAYNVLDEDDVEMDALREPRRKQ
jgi:hypothetical protein